MIWSEISVCLWLCVETQLGFIKGQIGVLLNIVPQLCVLHHILHDSEPSAVVSYASSFVQIPSYV